MWWLKLMLFLTFSCGAFSGLKELKSCQSKLTACKPDNFPDVVPKTRKEFDEDCELLKIFMKCIIREIEGCIEVLPFANESLHDFKEVESVISEACTKNSLMYEIISSNVECLHESMEYYVQFCGQSVDQVMVKYNDTFIGSGDGENDKNQYSKLTQCMMEAFDFSCFEENVSSNCGEAAGVAVKNIGKRLGLLSLCSEKVRRHLVGLLDEFETIDDDMKQYIKVVLELQK